MPDPHPAGAAAYGFPVRASTTVAAWLNPPTGVSGPVIDVRRAASETPGDTTIPGPEGVTISLAADRSRAWRRWPPDTTDDLVAHPGLASIAVPLALHLGGEALHAGGVLTPRGVVGLLAHRGAGKTTTLGYLALHGVPIVSDDQLVVRDGRLGAGPRTLDLRPDGASLLGIGDEAATVRHAQRRRMRLAPVPPDLELVELVVLGWGDRVLSTPVPPRERLPALAGHRTAPHRPGGPTVPLDLATLPMRRVVRPPGRAGLADLAATLLDG